MTDEERPFTKDFKDLFSTLIVSLPLAPHRVRFTRVDETFTSEEAINNLGSLKFSQSNRMPDPKDPSRIVTTTTTTTFSMAKEMARSVCQRFLDARFIEHADPRSITPFTLRGGVWQLTPKGINILHQFCTRNGITQPHVDAVFKRDQMQLIRLERDPMTDKLSQDKGTIEVIFRRFVGLDGPNVKHNTQSSDSDSLTDYHTGLVGVKMARERKIYDRTVVNSFTGKAACDWLMDCCTTIDRRETFELAEMFVRNQLISAVAEDKVYIHQNPTAKTFQPTKNAIYVLTERGQRLCGWLSRDYSDSSNDARDAKREGRGAKDSNNTRLNTILEDPGLRLMFREFLTYSLCDENLSFYLDVKEFTSNYRQLERMKAFTKTDAVRETLAGAYSEIALLSWSLSATDPDNLGLYNAFLAPGSPNELNIDHALRNSLASRMTRAVGDADAMVTSLREVVELFELAQNSVFKLMSSVSGCVAPTCSSANLAQDSVPKFIRDPKYAHSVREHSNDLGLNGRAYSPTPSTIPERSMSKSVRIA